MNPLKRPLLILTVIACSLVAHSAFAEPIDFSEVSLLVRARESERSIVQEVQRRKLVRALTPQQESTLRTQGAADSLVQALRGSGVILSATEVAAFEARREQKMNPPRNETRRGARVASDADGEGAENGFHVFEVSVGHPVNLSRWGGPDYEFAFRSPRRLDDGGEDAVLIDNVRTFTHTATYLGEGRADDSTSMYSRSNYVSVMDHAFTRGLRIDHKNPVSMKGLPYTLYPVYAAGGVSLYYIGATSDTVKLAVRTALR